MDNFNRSVRTPTELSRIILLLLCVFYISLCKGQSVISLRCENRINPLGIENKTPVLSWVITSSGRNVTQSAYQILTADNTEDLKKDKGTLWDSGKINSAQSIQVNYRGKTLLPAKKYYWKVKVWDNQGNVSAWSEPAFWQMGLTSVVDWKGAAWIAYDTLTAAQRIIPGVHGTGQPSWGPGRNILPLLRRDFIVKKPLDRAVMFISGLGHFELSINGKKTGDHFLDPGWAKYDKYAQYVTFDITNQLKKGKNALGVMLGNGFYYIPRERYRKITSAYGYPKMKCRLLVYYKDGSTENIVSDEQWKTDAGPMTYSSIYGGEDYDANLEQQGWNKPGFDDSQWRKALVTSGPALTSQIQEPVKIFENFSVKHISNPKPGIWVYDLGQNASAIPMLAISGSRNTVVKLSPAELLNPDGTINQSASGAPHFYQYTLKGGDKERWQPRFTYYGFRYVQVEGAVPLGYPNPGNLPVVHELKSLHIRNAAPQSGTFTCSNELFNQIFTLINWAVRSNMTSVLTDCPHREKLGWLEQAHLMGASVCYNYDIASLSRKIVRDMIYSQTAEGLIPDIAPEYVEFQDGFRDSPEWGSSGIIVPWYTYQWYGDYHLLEESYPMMQEYIAYLKSKASGNILSHGLGDWFDIGPGNPGESQLTPKGVTATAVYYYDLTLLTKIARLLNKPADELRYNKLAAEVRASFNKTFFDPQTKQYASGSQTANAMAVYMGLVEEKDKNAVIDNLVKEIRGRNNALTAGDIGYRYVLRVLEDAGRSDVIFDMNSRSDVPGYGWQLAHGATALTESWQAYGFVSNNHFMLGHLMEWFYSGLAGMRAAKDAVAFNFIEFRPSPAGDISSASADYQSPYGLIRSDWKKENGRFELRIEIPVNTKGYIYFPNSEGRKIIESGKIIDEAAGVKFLRNENGCSVYEAGSGNYSFSMD